MASNYKIVDPWAEGMNPPEQVFTNHGRITVEAMTVMFVEDPATGKRIKVVYDPQVLNPDGSAPRPVSQIKICLTPVNPNLKYDVIRESLVTSDDWAKITLPSIKSLGIMNLHELDGKYVEVQMADTGRAYQSNGVTKSATCFKFLRLFANENDCKEAAGMSQAAPSAPASAPAAAPTNGGSAEKVTATKFLGAYVKNAARAGGKDLEKTRTLLQTQIAQQPLLSKYFTVDSQEVVDLLMKELA